MRRVSYLLSRIVAWDIKLTGNSDGGGLGDGDGLVSVSEGGWLRAVGLERGHGGGSPDDIVGALSLSGGRLGGAVGSPWDACSNDGRGVALLVRHSSHEASGGQDHLGGSHIDGE